MNKLVIERLEVCGCSKLCNVNDSQFNRVLVLSHIVECVWSALHVKCTCHFYSDVTVLRVTFGGPLWDLQELAHAADNMLKHFDQSMYPLARRDNGKPLINGGFNGKINEHHL